MVVKIPRWDLSKFVRVSEGVSEELWTLCFGSKRSSPHVGNSVVHDGFITPGILLELDINTPGLSVKFSNPFPEKYEGA